MRVGNNSWEERAVRGPNRKLAESTYSCSWEDEERRFDGDDDG
jgi:hypothetical protein